MYMSLALNCTDIFSKEGVTYRFVPGHLELPHVLEQEHLLATVQHLLDEHCTKRSENLI